MILKIIILQKEHQEELIIENDSMLIQDFPKIKLDKLKSEGVFCINNQTPPGSFYTVKIVKNGSEVSVYHFDIAYLMNNEGKTIQKYG